MVGFPLLLAATAESGSKSPNFPQGYNTSACFMHTKSTSNHLWSLCIYSSMKGPALFRLWGLSQKQWLWSSLVPFTPTAQSQTATSLVRLVRRRLCSTTRQSVLLFVSPRPFCYRHGIGSSCTVTQTIQKTWNSSLEKQGSSTGWPRSRYGHKVFQQL